MQSDEEYSTPPEFEEEAKEILVLKMLPAKSKARYEQAYNSFVAWQKQTGKTTFTESVFILYFHEKSKTMSPTSLWSIYSMLRTTCELNNNVNIANFKKMKKILRKHSLGYISKKSKVFTPEDLNKFIQEAPDTEHLSNKVVAIFGISDACRSEELTKLKVSDVNLQGNTYVVDIPDAKTQVPRRFNIHEKFTDIIKKYINMRPQNCPVNRFFLNFQRGKCTNQPIGKNKFLVIPKKIAENLKLPEAKLYTGHSFRRTSATLLAQAGGDLTREGKQQYLNSWTDSSIRKAGLCGNHFKPTMFLKSCMPGSYHRLAQNAVPEPHWETHNEPERPVEVIILDSEPLLQNANENSNPQVLLEDNEMLCKEEYMGIEIKKENSKTGEVESDVNDCNEICTPGSYQRLVPDPHWETHTEPEIPAEEILPDSEPLLQNANENSNPQFLLEDNKIVCKEEYTSIEIKTEDPKTGEVQSDVKDCYEICTPGSYQRHFQDAVPDPHWETHTEPERPAEEILPDTEPLLQKANENSNLPVLLEDDEIVCEEEYTSIQIKMEEDSKTDIVQSDLKDCNEVPNDKVDSNPTLSFSDDEDDMEWTAIESTMMDREVVDATEFHTNESIDVQMLRRENERLRKEISLWKETFSSVNQQLHRTRDRRNFYRQQLQKLKNQTVDEFLDQQGCTNQVARTMIHLQLHEEYKPYTEEEKELAKQMFSHSASGYNQLQKAGCILPHENHVRRWQQSREN